MIDNEKIIKWIKESIKNTTSKKAKELLDWCIYLIKKGEFNRDEELACEECEYYRERNTMFFVAKTYNTPHNEYFYKFCGNCGKKLIG